MVHRMTYENAVNDRMRQLEREELNLAELEQAGFVPKQPSVENAKVGEGSCQDRDPDDVLYDRQMVALDASIRAWWKKYEEKDPDKMKAGPLECPLCVQFNTLINKEIKSEDQCRQCPIMLMTGKKECYGTSYGNAARKLEVYRSLRRAPPPFDKVRRLAMAEIEWKESALSMMDDLEKAKEKLVNEYQARREEKKRLAEEKNKKLTADQFDDLCILMTRLASEYHAPHSGRNTIFGFSLPKWLYERDDTFKIVHAMNDVNRRYEDYYFGEQGPSRDSYRISFRFSVSGMLERLSDFGWKHSENTEHAAWRFNLTRDEYQQRLKDLEALIRELHRHAEARHPHDVEQELFKDWMNAETRHLYGRAVHPIPLHEMWKNYNASMKSWHGCPDDRGQRIGAHYPRTSLLHNLWVIWKVYSVELNGLNRLT